MAKQRKPGERTERCPDCGKMFTPQGLFGHRKWAHGELPPVKAQLPLEPKREPALVKPALPIETLETLMERAELADNVRTSPCCSARLRSAKRVLGIADLALDRCFICARCGEWYLDEPGGYLVIYADGSRGVSYLQHLPQEPVPKTKTIQELLN